MLIGQLPQGRWNVGCAFRHCTCNIINSLIGHEYTHSANEYTHLSVWDHDSVYGGTHPPRGGPPCVLLRLQCLHTFLVSAQLYGILDHMDSSSIHCFVSAGCQTKQDWTRLDLRVCGQSRNNISATQTLSGAQTEAYCERTLNTYRGCRPLWLKSPVLALLSDATLHSNFSLFH